MHIQPTRRSSLFLMELIIAILFFSLASSICVRVFVKSHSLEKESINLNHAVTAATSAAEIFRNHEQPFSILSELYPDGSSLDDTFEIYYDNNWLPCTQSHASFTVQLMIEQTNSFLLGYISVHNERDSFYTLEVKKYLGREGDSVET